MDAHQTTAAGLANYANSITTTPGTVTVEIDETIEAKPVFGARAASQNLAMMCVMGIWTDNCALEGEAKT